MEDGEFKKGLEEQDEFEDNVAELELDD